MLFQGLYSYTEGISIPLFGREMLKNGSKEGSRVMYQMILQGFLIVAKHEQCWL